MDRVRVQQWLVGKGIFLTHSCNFSRREQKVGTVTYLTERQSKGKSESLLDWISDCSLPDEQSPFPVCFSSMPRVGSGRKCPQFGLLANNRSEWMALILANAKSGPVTTLGCLCCVNKMFYKVLGQSPVRQFHIKLLITVPMTSKQNYNIILRVYSRPMIASNK